ncbi:phosphoribosyltransferase [Candidatus Bathyarchaeota archaeon]|nr:phosphoribosyltransferase [Candidatus Bathyarchaeota archaeon]
MDRCEAGRLLATMIRGWLREDSVILAVPSGGVPVGYCLAEQLKLPLDIVVVRKIPVPGNPEAGFGAVAPDGTLVLNQRLVDELGLDQVTISRLAASRLREVEARLRRFRGGRKPIDLAQKEPVLVDDGLASGFTMLAAVRSIKRHNPRTVVVAVPTAHYDALRLVASEADMVYCLNVRSGFLFAVADAYVDWYDLDDREVQGYLQKAWAKSPE